MMNGRRYLFCMIGVCVCEGRGRGWGLREGLCEQEMVCYCYVIAVCRPTP